MENCQLTVRLGDVSAECFLLSGFFQPSGLTSPIHTHKYAEIHMIADGRMTLYTGQERWELCAGDALLIPAGCPHRIADSERGTRDYTFLLQPSVENPRKCRIPVEVLDRLLLAAARLRESGESAGLAGYLAYILSELCPASVRVLPIQDRAFIIHDFFMHNYDKDVTLRDIAAALYVSEKQAHRLLLKYTGDSFSVNLSKNRIEAAKLLMETEPGLSLAEIARMVGYHTYSGFWKAYRKYR